MSANPSPEKREDVFTKSLTLGRLDGNITYVGVADKSVTVGEVPKGVRLTVYGPRAILGMNNGETVLQSSTNGEISENNGTIKLENEASASIQRFQGACTLSDNTSLYVQSAQAGSRIDFKKRYINPVNGVIFLDDEAVKSGCAPSEQRNQVYIVSPNLKQDLTKFIQSGVLSSNMKKIEYKGRTFVLISARNIDDRAKKGVMLWEIVDKDGKKTPQFIFGEPAQRNKKVVADIAARKANFTVGVGGAYIDTEFDETVYAAAKRALLSDESRTAGVPAKTGGPPTIEQTQPSIPVRPDYSEGDKAMLRDFSGRQLDGDDSRTLAMFLSAGLISQAAYNDIIAASDRLRQETTFSEVPFDSLPDGQREAALPHIRHKLEPADPRRDSLKKVSLKKSLNDILPEAEIAKLLSRVKEPVFLKGTQSIVAFVGDVSSAHRLSTNKGRRVSSRLFAKISKPNEEGGNTTRSEAVIHESIAARLPGIAEFAVAVSDPYLLESGQVAVLMEEGRGDQLDLCSLEDHKRVLFQIFMVLQAYHYYGISHVDLAKDNPNYQSARTQNLAGFSPDQYPPRIALYDVGYFNNDLPNNPIERKSKTTKDVAKFLGEDDNHSIVGNYINKLPDTQRLVIRPIIEKLRQEPVHSFLQVAEALDSDGKFAQEYELITGRKPRSLA
ncbi:hypothetical protein HY214_00585 [Candidatus Roizmanbacteria bacterium]|nr:hypothetical protein [Candidatus Roizmanbacteria bacterium]